MVLLVAVCSVLGALSWASYVRVQATRNFQVSASTTADALSSALQRTKDLALTARVLVETDPTIADPRFANWFRLLEAHGNYASSFGLLYLARVAAPQLQTFERRTEEAPPFGVANLGPFRMTPPTAKAPYCLTDAGAVDLRSSLGIPTQAVMPLLALAAADLDFCALPIGRQLQASAQSGRPAAATLASLLATIPEFSSGPGLPRSVLGTLDRDGLIATLTPVYTRTASTPSAREAALQGWILNVFEGRTVLSPALVSRRHFSAVLSFQNPPAHRVVLDVAGRHDAGVSSTAAGGTSRTFELTRHGPWFVTLTAPPMGTSATAQGIVVLLGGLLISFLLFAVVRLLVRSRREAFHLVDQRTAELLHQARHDPLTGLPNRAAMFELVEAALARPGAAASEVAVVLVDLDHFNDVNDRFGSQAGDDVLRQVAARFRAAAGHAVVLGRMGGDDFLALIEEGPALEKAQGVAHELLSAMAGPFRTGRTPAAAIDLTASAGIAAGVRHTAEVLVSDAGIACLEARETDSRILTFRPEMRAAVHHRIDTESELRAAFAEDRFFLVYQ
ncbi:MAG: diguanylate cyclase domain-containing protein, partial [Acidimicrobiales bacterium]